MRLRKPCEHDRYAEHPWDREGQRVLSWHDAGIFAEDFPSVDIETCPGGEFLPEGALVDDLLIRISRWIDDAPNNTARDREAALWGRVSKVAEESGEAIAALIGATGQNPRKGTTHVLADVCEELLDVALTALAAWYHITEDRDISAAFAGHVSRRADQVGLLDALASQVGESER